MLIAAQLVKRFSARLHPAVMMLVGGISATTPLLFFSYSREVVPAIVMAILLGIGWSFMQTTFQTWAIEILPTARPLVISLIAGWLFAGTALQAVVVRDADHAEFAGIYFTMVLGRHRSNGLRSGRSAPVAEISRRRSPCPLIRICWSPLRR